MTKIRVDKNGNPYVIINGGVYRPQKGPWEYAHPKRNWGDGITSEFALGGEVQVRNVNQSPFCKVRTLDGAEELWTVHGHDVKNPEACFFEKPDTKTLIPEPKLLSSLVATTEQLDQRIKRPKMKI